MPNDLFFGTSIATCILVLKKNKLDNNILFVDASNEFIRNTNKKVYLVVNQECTSKIFKDILSTYEKDILKEENECPICGSSLIIKPTDDKEELECSNEKCSYHRDINEN